MILKLVLCFFLLHTSSATHDKKINMAKCKKCNNIGYHLYFVDKIEQFISVMTLCNDVTYKISSISFFQIYIYRDGKCV